MLFYYTYNIVAPKLYLLNFKIYKSRKVLWRGENKYQEKYIYICIYVKIRSIKFLNKQNRQTIFSEETKKRNCFWFLLIVQ